MMNSFLRGCFSLFDWMFPRTMEERMEDLDDSMQDLYDRMGWGEYQKPYPMSGYNNVMDINLTTSKQFLDEMTKLAEECEKSGGFQPYAYYNSDMDSIQVYFKDTSSYTQPLNQNVEIHLSHDTDEITGATILNIKNLLGIS